jgi:hypothetical protein
MRLPVLCKWAIIYTDTGAIIKEKAVHSTWPCLNVLLEMSYEVMDC